MTVCHKLLIIQIAVVEDIDKSQNTELFIYNSVFLCNIRNCSLWNILISVVL